MPTPKTDLASFHFDNLIAGGIDFAAKDFLSFDPVFINLLLETISHPIVNLIKPLVTSNKSIDNYISK